MFTKSTLTSALSLVIGLSAGVGCQQKPKALQHQPSLALESCRIGKLRGTQLCAYLSRPRDPKDPSAGDIPIAVTVVEGWGQTSNKQSPLFLLAGGPGQSAREAFGRMPGLITAWSKHRDIVLMDIRGTGDSDPIECDLDTTDDHSDSIEQSTAKIVNTLKGCQVKMKDRRPHHYFTPRLADDIDAVRQALGYETISLYGGSYGTRLAMEYARRHDAHTHALVLDGIAPVALAMPWNFAQTFEASWNKIADYCEQDQACNTRFPKMRSSLSRLKDQVAAAPEKTFKLTHPSRDLDIDFKPDPRGVARLYFPASYSPQMWTMLPLAIDKALEGKWATTLGILDQGDIFEINPMVLYSIACNEDRKLWKEDERQAMQQTLLGDVHVSLFEAVCPLFTSKHPLPETYFEPISSTKPALFLSGEADPVTPPDWAGKVSPHFPNSLSLTVPFTGHNTIATRCIQDIVNEFLSAKEPLSIETDCVAKTRAPFFFTNLNGPSRNFKAAQSPSDAPSAQKAEVTP